MNDYAKQHHQQPAGRPAVAGGSAVADEVTERVLRRVLSHPEPSEHFLDDLLCETIYREQRRLADDDDDPRGEEDRRFIKWLRHELARGDRGQRSALVRTVLAHYANEISGHFDRHVYSVATRVVPAALGALLHGGKPSPELFDVDDRVLLEGDVAGLQRLVGLGTVVLVPTHTSNLDALVLGYTIYRLGLPPFAYGAGLNLFSNAVTGFFMRHLGAFTVDRKKSDPLYRAAVKEYATVLLEQRQHLLFFPGGTRSRSGALERHLKLGFLSRIVTAFGNRKARDPHSPPMFVVPCTLSYPLVLEAASLIDQYLSKEGGPHFVDVRDEFEHPTRWLGFLSGLAELDVRIHLRFGSPLDPIGNDVDPDGVSRDQTGRALDPARYLLAGGKVVEDEARDAEYTKALATRVLASYRRELVALPSSVLAFALFACLQRRFPRLDLFRLLRVLGPRTTIDLAELEPQIGVVLDGLKALAASGSIVLAPELRHADTAAVLERGCATLSTYHRPAVLTRYAQTIEVEEPKLLFFYSNRLEGYGLPGSLAHFEHERRAHTWSVA